MLGHRIRNLGLLVLSVGFLAVGFQNFGLISLPSQSDVIRLEDLQLPLSHRCGEGLEKIEIGQWQTFAFPVPGDHSTNYWTWHNSMACLSDLLSSLNGSVQNKRSNQEILAKLILGQTAVELNRSAVSFYLSGNPERLKFSQVAKFDSTGGLSLRLSKFDHISFDNEDGVPYNSMSQLDFAKWLFAVHLSIMSSGQEHPLYRYSDLFFNLGKAVVVVVTDDEKEGGLAVTHTCIDGTRKCTIYRSITKRSKGNNQGVTLNQMLHVIRDLGSIGSQLLKAKYQSNEAGYRAERLGENLLKASEQGFLQILQSDLDSKDVGPKLGDYLPRDSQGKLVSGSWLYYGYQLSGQRPYFLGKTKGHLNCHYHLHVLELLAQLIEKNRSGTEAAIPEEILNLQKANVRWILEQYLKRRDSHSLYSAVPFNPHGNYIACDKEKSHEVDPRFVRILQMWLR